MLVVGLGTPEESEPDFAIELDGAVVELAIPADEDLASNRRLIDYDGTTIVVR